MLDITMGIANNTVRRSLAAGCWLLAAGCAQLPDAGPMGRNATQVEIEGARGPLSAQRVAAILAGLSRNAGDLDILQQHVALEQAIVGTPLTAGNRVLLLQGGAATYRAMFAAIGAATDHVNLESYIIEDDEIGRQFSELLLQKRSQGVQVNLVYDSVGSMSTPKAFFDRLRAGGVQVLEFNPVNPLSAKKEWLVNNRDHRKLLVIDGRTAFVGGINFSRVHSGGSFARGKVPGAGPAWRDTDLRIEGPVVDEFQKLFMQTWAKQRGAPLATANYFPALAAKGGEMVRAIGSTSDDPHSLIYLTLIAAIFKAQRHVYLTTAYFVPDPQLLDALTDAAGRGVDVRLVLPGESDSTVAFHAGRSHYSALLRAGVKIHERRGAMLHAKTATIDGVWSCVGSTNLDRRSFLHNDEIDAAILGREFAGQMQAAFAADLEASEAMDLERWEARPFYLRLKEWAARLWEYWL
ncbi:MAG TPA: phospholipase D-like domain-containing protein [Burkholderiales bacterium]|nr:phospholipase D-like domain-containing protein [Burkholderiales bacterium]